MRPVAEFPISHGAPVASPGRNTTALHSPWQSPVPYLFGGLAAMLGLIAFALLILACSYWKLSGYLDRSDQAGSGDQAEGEKGSEAGAAKPAVVFREHVVVIMAGDERPTFLATPATSRAVVEHEAQTMVSCGAREEKKVEECEESSEPTGDTESHSHGRNTSTREHESS